MKLNEDTYMDKRTDYVEKLSAQMVEWDVQIDQLKYKADSATTASKSDFSRAIELWKIKRDEAAEKLQGISSAGDDEWEELKTGTERVWGEVRTILHDSITNIK